MSCDAGGQLSYKVTKHLFIKIRWRVLSDAHIKHIIVRGGGRVEAGGWGRGVWPGGRPRNRLFSNGQLPIIPAVINHRRLTNEVEQSARDGA